MVGRPLLSLPEGTHTTCVPDKLKCHPLIREICFYTLPTQILASIEKNVKGWSLDHESWLLEKELGAICGDHSTQVGFNDGQSIEYHLLRGPDAFRLNLEQIKSMNWEGMNDAKIAAFVRDFDGRRKWYHTSARGYAGWLNCNPEFCRERDAAIGKEYRVVSLAPSLSANASGGSLPISLQSFLVRWRLMGMAGPRLPVPMQPMMGGEFPVSILPQLMDAGGVFNIPDTCPLPSRDELREMLQDAIRGRTSDHLDEWYRVIATANSAKTEISRYARLLELQHYWELIQVRHEDRVHRRLKALRRVIGEFLGASLASIEGDLRFLRGKLGSNFVA